ncbi:aminotransferase class I/II-fold pyridoxal phosphate-dependent enzyme [Candidatus Uhrbacteria bacterium]|nr:aminotransferase class I/II-fold pyridoxal phosphate-dependent enzyme [Candidatus Uhrbacteria bacterium]
MSKDLPAVSPETFSLHGGYDPARSEGAVKPPLFATSTFAVKTAVELAGWFRQAYGLDGKPPSAPDGLIYSRLVNPDLQIFEERWSVYEGAEQSALCASGMAAIVTALLTLCRPGDTVLYSVPVYGGTDYFMEHLLPAFNIHTQSFPVTASGEDVTALIAQCQHDDQKVKVVYLESPANPTLSLADVGGIARAVHALGALRPMLVVDNTVLGPVFYRPMELGADLVVHSATKSIGGHSDLIAGIVCGSSELIAGVKATRTIFGTMADPHTAWLLLRSLETYKVRVEAAEKKAEKVVAFLRVHPTVEEVFFPDTCGGEQSACARSQCSGHGSLLSFTVRGGREAAYCVLDHLRVTRLAVSLGSTESLAEHPRTHTHSDITPADLDRFGITEGMIRLSVGLEDADDIIADLAQALNELL